MTSATLDPAALRDHVARSWRDSILPAISDFIRIPAKSPAFDADWAANGFLDEAVELAEVRQLAPDVHARVQTALLRHVAEAEPDVLRDRTAVPAHRAGIRNHEPEHRPHRCGLACTIRP